MLDNTITLAVDPSGDNTTTSNEVLTRFREYENKTEYQFADHTVVTRDQLEFYRNVITPSGNYLGNAKGSLKLTEDRGILAKDGSDLVAPTIAGISMSLPVGTTDSMFYHILGRLQALVLNKSLMYNLFMKQSI